MGDPAGIGPEIIAKLWAERNLPGAFVIGDETILQRAINVVGADLALRTIAGPAQVEPQPGRIDILPESNLPGDLPFGRIDARAGAAAYEYVNRAIRLALAGDIGAIVTAPLNKEALKAAGINYPGHTEILAEHSGSSEFGMMLANEELRVLLVSIHVPLSEAIRRVTPEAELRAIRLAYRGCRDFGIDRPRIAVAGLNPHAGENGLFGREDIEAIQPAVNRARDEG
jgi:4-hydroxythreonine-4-phosphate dehydrogenase